jgi:hypothetical protein
LAPSFGGTIRCILEAVLNISVFSRSIFNNPKSKSKMGIRMEHLSTIALTHSLLPSIVVTIDHLNSKPSSILPLNPILTLNQSNHAQVYADTDMETPLDQSSGSSTNGAMFSPRRPRPATFFRATTTPRVFQ